jgi:hypothetical protein
VERAEGIPLYAVETIRMLVADGRLRPRDDGAYEPAGELGELAVPPTLHALIAARLDALEPGDRAMLQDAAVLGQSFTADALAVVTTEGTGLADRLDRAVRGELLRLEVDPASPERGQYAFVGSLVREVAYSTLALRDRRARHLAAARYFEGLGDDELAGALAVHYVAAFRSSTEGPETDALAAQARLALRGAAERAMDLGSPAQALRFAEQALEITSEPAQVAAFHELAIEAATQAALREDVLRHAGDAERLLRGLGERSRVAMVLSHRGRALIGTGRSGQARTMLEAAASEFADLPEADPGHIALLEALGGAHFGEAEWAKAAAIADRILAASERGNLPASAAYALIQLGTVAALEGRRWHAGALIRGARQIAEEAGLAATAIEAASMLASLVALDDPGQALAIQREAIALARRHGRRASEIMLVSNASEDARRTGDWDWALGEQATTLGQAIEAFTSGGIRGQRAFYEVHRELVPRPELHAIVDWMLALEDSDMQGTGLDLQAQLAFSEGRWGDAAAAWRRVAEVSEFNAPYSLPRAARAAILARDATVAQAAIDGITESGARGRAIEADVTAARAGIAALRSDPEAALEAYRTARVAYRDLGLVWDQALLAMEAASVLPPSTPEVAAWLEEARTILAGLRARPLAQRLEEIAARPGDAPAAPGAPPARRGEEPLAGAPASPAPGAPAG